MILLTRLSRAPLVLNSDLIEHIEAAPDTVISLLNGQKLLVLESPEEIIERVIQFRRAIVAQPFLSSPPASPEGYYPYSAFVRSSEASLRKRISAED
jgi:flagellar protein FlbD